MPTPFIDLMNEDKTDNLDAPLLAAPRAAQPRTPQATGANNTPRITALPPAASPAQNAGPQQGASINSLPQSNREPAMPQLAPEAVQPAPQGVLEQADALRNGAAAAQPPDGNKYLDDMRKSVYDALATETNAPQADKDIADLRQALRLVASEKPKQPTVAEQLGVRKERVRDLFGVRSDSYVIEAPDGSIYDLGDDIDINDDAAVKARVKAMNEARESMEDYYNGGF